MLRMVSVPVCRVCNGSHEAHAPCPASADKGRDSVDDLGEERVHFGCDVSQTTGLPPLAEKLLQDLRLGARPRQLAGCQQEEDHAERIQVLARIVAITGAEKHLRR